MTMAVSPIYLFPDDQMIIEALDLTINNYDQNSGFVSLPEKLSDYAITCMILDVCPTLVRKAFMEGEERKEEN